MSHILAKRGLMHLCDVLTHSLQDDILDWSKLKQIADDILEGI